MRHNILVTGSNGQLGMEIRNLALGRDIVPGREHDNTCSRIVNADDCFLFTARHELPYMETETLDITDLDAVREMIEVNAIDIIVNCAAYTDVEKAEGNFEEADLQNHIAVDNLAEAAREFGITLIHISTDYVFGGESSKPYTELDGTSPLGVYGLTKLAGERAILDSGCDHVILRTSWLYSPYGRNFVKTMKRLTAEKDELNVVIDEIGTPTYARDLAQAIIDIIHSGKTDICSGIYNYSGEGLCSRYDLAYEVGRLCGNVCRLKPCLSVDFPTVAARPHYSVLDKTLIKTTFDLEIPHWTESLRHCIGRMKKMQEGE